MTAFAATPLTSPNYYDYPSPLSIENGNTAMLSLLTDNFWSAKMHTQAASFDTICPSTFDTSPGEIGKRPACTMCFNYHKAQDCLLVPVFNHLSHKIEILAVPYTSQEPCDDDLFSIIHRHLIDHPNHFRSLTIVIERIDNKYRVVDTRNFRQEMVNYLRIYDRSPWAIYWPFNENTRTHH